MKKLEKLLIVAAFSVLPFSVFASNESPTDIDSLLRGKEYQFPPLDSSYRTNYSDVSHEKSSGKEQETIYVLQFDAVANFDAAQARRAKLQVQTGYDIQMVFDAPFYKLRGGYFKKKTEAEDKARELSLYNISAFAVKVK
ncbi:MAG: SPOR domain-containing protein [Fibromonadaceae bacterium]|jgi:hypothetical protein|nr:SPOR domain-containing protein [Fibromonadaceae bacterium]